MRWRDAARIATTAVVMASPRTVIAWLLLISAVAPLPAAAQDAQTAAFKPEELEQLVAPIALHPDSLLVQVLMASTYPMEVVQAARFVKDNAALKGDQLNEALKQHTWDDSVKSLVMFPQILTMMNDKLDWLQKLGDAFLAQQQDLMAAIQRLRARAQASGQLKSTPEQNVIVEPAAAVAAPPAQSPTVEVVQAPPTVIKIEPANPQVVAVPSYDPTVVYGAWPYPAYPPVYPYPPGYFAASAFMFAGGMAVGAALWGGADWHGGDININNNNANNFTRNVNNNQQASARVEQRQSAGGSGAGAGNRSKWQHSPEHRKGVQYRDTKTQQRFDRTGPANAQSREAFRGRTGQGSDVSRAAQQGGRGGPSATTRDSGGGFGDRSGGVGQGGGGGRQAGAFEGAGGGGRSAQSYSDRGNSSRESFNRSSGGGGRSSAGAAGGRSGGGGARGGGGGRGGGGRR